MKKLSLALAAIMLLSVISGCSMLPQSAPVEEETAPEEIPAYGYIAAEELKAKLEAGEEMVIVDIQPEEYYEQAHLPGSLSTGAYPADTDELRSRLDAAIDSINATTAPVIIIGMGGKSGAKNAAEY
ncbi:MAG: rhodanese-like domain-containing protein [Clostridia bacterium]|nr:rhodanese-like domain-containing protein [Clostridia bacterium]